MALKVIRSALLLLTLAAAPAALASEPGRGEPPDPARQPEAQAERRGPRQSPPELICRSVEIAGSRDATPMVCMSATDWRRAEQ